LNQYHDPYGHPPPGDIAESILPPEQRRALEPTTFTAPAPTLPPTPNGAERPPLSIHHVGVAVSSIDEAMKFYGETLGLEVMDRRILGDRGLEIAFVQAENTLIELLQPLDPEGTVARFIERRGQGMHHLCFGTPDIESHIRDLLGKGVEMIDTEPRPGAHGDVAFIQPASSFGVLVELIQEKPFVLQPDGGTPEPQPEVA
jgi:methylmalonyl-CoA/ethylmalonyl-CoA epimerase